MASSVASGVTLEAELVALHQVYQSLAQKDQEIKELQQLRLFDNRWKTHGIPQPNLCRSTDAVTDGCDYIYMRQAQSEPAQIYMYQVSMGQPQLLIESTTLPIRWPMVYFSQHLIIIGGAHSKEDQAQCTNQLVGISSVDGNFVTDYHYPIMPTSRSRATALTCRHPQQGVEYLIVIGGEDDKDTTLKTVEILNLTDPSRGWYKAQDLPESLSCTSGTIAQVLVNGQSHKYVYVLGGWSKRNQPTAAVFRGRLDILIATSKQAATFPQFQSDVWETLPPLPVAEATCTTLNNQLIVVGGRANTVPVHDIRCYNEEYKRWDVIGYLRKPRYLCFAVGLPGKLVIIGGKKDDTSYEKTVEIYIYQ